MNIIYFTKLNFIKGSENESAEESDDGDDDEEDEDGQKSLASLGLVKYSVQTMSRLTTMTLNLTTIHGIVNHKNVLLIKLFVFFNIGQLALSST